MFAVQRKRRVISANRLFEPAQVAQQIGAVVMGRGVARIGSKRAVQELKGSVVPSVLRFQNTKKMQCVRLIGKFAEDFRIVAFGFRYPALLMQRNSLAQLERGI